LLTWPFRFAARLLRRKIPRPPPADWVLLAGDRARPSFDAALKFASRLPARSSVLVIGFSFEPHPPAVANLERGDLTVRCLPGAAFPEFHGALVQAALAAEARRAVVFDPGLLGLGLGALCAFHRGTPLALADQVTPPNSTQDSFKTPSQEDPKLLDPRDDLWRIVCNPLIEVFAEKRDDLASQVLAAASEFLDWFAAFHELGRINRCAG
jgi:hypothetical protein